MDMMRKFYRNRHTSFLQALVEQKTKKEQEDKAVKEAAEKKKQKITQKVLGDGSRIRSKLFEPTAASKDEGEESGASVPATIAFLQNLNSTTKSTIVRSSSKQPRGLKRGNSVSSLSQAEKAYNDGTSTNVSSGQKRNQVGSRGSTRAASSKGGNSERKTVANRSAQNFTRGRTLTPKVYGAKAKQEALNKEIEMTEEQKLEFDEKREQEIL